MQLITQEDVLSLAFSPDDAIDPAHIREARIEAAQLRYIRPAFGEAMYRRMILEQYRDFVCGYIKPALAHFVRYELIGELAVRASDRGIVRPSSSETTQTSSATKNDSQDRTDTVRSESTRQQIDTKTSSETTTRLTTDHSTTKQEAEEQTLREANDQQTVTVSSLVKGSVEGTASTQEDTSISMSLTEKQEVQQSSDSKDTLDKTILSEESTQQSLRADTVDGTRQVDGEDSGSTRTESELNDLTNRSTTVAAVSKSENTGNGTTVRTSLGAASADEWQLLSRQALRDARTFLRVAVEYVEANCSEFPEYDPASGLGSSSARRCIGGIIL